MTEEPKDLDALMAEALQDEVYASGGESDPDDQPLMVDAAESEPELEPDQEPEEMFQRLEILSSEEDDDDEDDELLVDKRPKNADWLKDLQKKADAKEPPKAKAKSKPRGKAKDPNSLEAWITKYQKSELKQPPYKPFPALKEPKPSKDTLREDQVLEIISKCESGEPAQLPAKYYHYMAKIGLRAHQIEGVAIMFRICRQGNKTGGIIQADEMGVGKTAQVILLIVILLDMIRERTHPMMNKDGSDESFLVVVPPNVLRNWPVEVAKWSNLICYSHHGNHKLPSDVSHAADKRPKAHIILMTYEGLRLVFCPTPAPGEFDKKTMKPHEIQSIMMQRAKDKASPLYKYLFQHKWRMLVFDEAHKGPGGFMNSGQAKPTVIGQTIHDIQAMTKCAMTGTSLTNNPSNFVSLVALVGSGTEDRMRLSDNWLNARELAEWKMDKTFPDGTERPRPPKYTLKTPRAVRWMDYHLIQRTKDELGLRKGWKANYLYPQIPQSATHKQQERILMHRVKDIQDQVKAGTRSRAEGRALVLQLTMHMRMASLDLSLIAAYDATTESHWKDFETNEKLRKLKQTRKLTVEEQAEMNRTFETIFRVNPKLKWVIDKTREILARPSGTCLYFAESLKLLDLVSAYLIALDIIPAAPLTIRGKTSVDKRQAISNLFMDRENVATRPKQWRLCMCQIRAAAEGLNILASDVIILQDAWNDAVLDQAAGRADRIGAVGEVNIWFPRVVGDVDRGEGGHITSDEFGFLFRRNKSEKGSGVLKQSALSLDKYKNIPQLTSSNSIGKFISGVVTYNDSLAAQEVKRRQETMSLVADIKSGKVDENAFDAAVEELKKQRKKDKSSASSEDKAPEEADAVSKFKTKITDDLKKKSKPRPKPKPKPKPLVIDVTNEEDPPLPTKPKAIPPLKPMNPPSDKAKPKSNPKKVVISKPQPLPTSSSSSSSAGGSGGAAPRYSDSKKRVRPERAPPAKPAPARNSLEEYDPFAAVMPPPKPSLSTLAFQAEKDKRKGTKLISGLHLAPAPSSTLPLGARQPVPLKAWFKQVPASSAVEVLRQRRKQGVVLE